MGIMLKQQGVPLATSLFGLKQCPATCGLPLTTTEKGFAGRCKAELEKDDNPNRPGYCRAVCKGKKRPAELTILKLEYLENDMQPKKDKRGVCESCGDVLLLKLSNGMQVCGKCSTIYSNTRNWLPTVEASLAFIYPEKYGAGAEKTVLSGTTGSPSTKQLQEQIYIEKRRGDDLTKSYEELSQGYDEYRKNTEGTETQLQYLSEGYAAIRSALGCTDPTFDIVESIGELAQTLDRYKKRCEKLEKDIIRKDNLLQGSIDALMCGSESTEMPNKPMVPEHNNIDKHLLDLAKVFLKNPNAGCDEVADWIDVVREAA